MAQNTSLEKTVDTVLGQVEGSVLARLAESHSESQKVLDTLRPRLETEYDRILSEASKEAEQVERQITGSAELDARNAQLRLVEEATDRVFVDATLRIAKISRDATYSKILSALLTEATNALGTTDVLVSTNKSDADAVAAAIKSLDGAELVDERIECMGGVRLSTRDGLTSFDNTLDAKLNRLKPLIRKEIASRFGLGK